MSLRQLEAHAGRARDELERLASTAGRFYRPFDIAQHKSDGRKKWRHIDNPSATLKDVQRAIQRRVLAAYPFPVQMYGGVSGKSIRENGLVHVGQTELVTLDLADCFPNIGNLRVFDTYRARFGASADIASILTRLTTFQGRLPQGAPTSPLLANLVMLELYDEIAAFCTRAGLNWSFFVDDIAISGDGAWKAIEPITKLISEHGFRVSPSKVTIMPGNEMQRVTGTVVNRKTSVGRAYLKKVREEIYILAHRRTVTDRDIQHVRGLISNAKHMCPEQGHALKAYFERWLPKRDWPQGLALKAGPEIRNCEAFVRAHHEPQPVGGSRV